MKRTFINNKSIKIRFFTSLFVNIARMGLGFIAGVMIARNLGPADYGNYNFLLGSFVAIVTLFGMGTSSAFYTFLSQRKRSSKFYIYYFLWMAIQFLVILFLIAIIFPEAWRNKIWLGHGKGMIMLAFIASFAMNNVWQMATHIGESIRATVIVQLHNIAIASLYLCGVLAIVFLRYLTISNLFIIITFVYLLSSFILVSRLKGNLTIKETVTLSGIINGFKTYCTPLILYNMVSFAYSFADVWLLQKFSGAVQQGYYSIGLRFSAVCLIATTSILQVFWKEITEASELGNRERLHYLYTKISRGLCFMGALGACFLIPFSREILVYLFGQKYEAGWPCVAIMFLYPIHQSLGQINGSYFYATAQTKAYSNIGIIMMIVSILVAYFVLASHTSIIPGLGLGSVGLALKMVILQIIGVNVLSYFICRASGWRFYFLYQFGIILFLLVVSFAVKGFLAWFFNIFNASFQPLALMVFCMPFYMLAAGLGIYLFPGLCGLERKEMPGFLRRF